MARFRQVRVSALEGKVNFGPESLQKFTAEVPAEVVAAFEVDRVFDTEGGFQRSLDKSRAKKIGVLMGGDKKKGIEPRPNVHGSIIAFTPDPKAVTYRGGRLTIRAPLHILDGQTRAAGCAWALEHNGEAPWTETVEIIVGAPITQLAEWFITINMTMRKVDPGTMLLDIVRLEGVEQNRKTWIARHMMSLATDEPFYDGEHRLVSFRRGDGGVIQAYTLYKAVNFMLPPDLNKEGDVEPEALTFARDAFKLYAAIYGDAWMKTDANGKIVKHDAHSFTLMAAFGRVYRQATVQHGHSAKTDAAVRRAWHKAELDKGLPEGSGSGERAAVALASHVAGEMNLKVDVAA